jgi:hypothetical protein
VIGHLATAILTLMAGIACGLAASGLWLRRMRRRDLTLPGRPPEPPDLRQLDAACGHPVVTGGKLAS